MPSPTPTSGNLNKGPAELDPATLPERLGAGRLAQWREAARRNPKEWFANWLTAALVLRLILVALPIGFFIDIDSFRAWALKLAESGPTKFYENIWSDYPPGYMYILWFLGCVHQLLEWSAGIVGQLLGRPPQQLVGLQIFLIKLPAIAADILNSWLIFKILEHRVSLRTAYRAALVYAFNPITILVSALWGQMDAVLLSAMLGAVYFILAGRLLRALLLTTLAVLIKPQGLFLVPALLIVQWHRHSLSKWLGGIAASVILGWLVVLPFTIVSSKYAIAWDLKTPLDMVWHLPQWLGALLSPFPFLWDKMVATANTYPYSSVNAFNLWMPTKMWQPDSRLFLGIEHRFVGLSLLLGTFGLMFWAAFKQRDQWRPAKTFALLAIVLLACFLLPTRMHERYLLPAVAMLALAAAANRNLRWNYYAFSFVATVNVLYAFCLYYSPGKWWEPIKAYLESLWGIELVMLGMWLFGDLVGTFLTGHSEPGERLWWKPILAALVETRGRLASAGAAIYERWCRRDWLTAGIISGVFFLISVWNLFTPNEQIFDEVYHARTAKEFIDGTNPYEWTHPHLGKLFIAAGVLAMNRVNLALEAIGLRKVIQAASPPSGAVPQGFFDGFDAFGWRIGSLVVASLTLILLYVLARRLFHSPKIAAIATGILALDGVFFVQSRVAMTNIFVVSFILLGAIGLWEYLSRTVPPGKDLRHEPWLLLWGFGIGCALASRWSALFAWGLGVGLIGLHWLILRRKALGVPGTALFALRLAVYIVVIPLAVYALTYIPWLIQDKNWATPQGFIHRLGELWQMQKNMWGYHAGMTATHNYESPWWTWPFMHRPTWYYFHDWKNGTISGIVAIGNPAIWWLYIPVMALLTYHLWRERDWRVGFILTFGLGLWLAWGIEPRKLVFMHYLFETLPFLAIGIAYFAERLLNRQTTRPVAIGYLVVMASLWVFWYPLLAAIPIPWPFYSAHIWVHPFWY